VGSDLTNNPLLISSASYSSLDDRINACMTYPRAIGFAVLKLSGLKVRVTSFSMKRILANSEYIQFSNSASNLIHLPPGRYAIVPFTDIIVNNQVLDYCLVIQCKEGAVEYEINDIVKERPIDEMPSDDEEEGGTGGSNQILERQQQQLTGGAGSRMGKCPLLLLTERWEWEEQIEEIANIAIYEQINDLAFLLRHLKKDIKDMQRGRVEGMESAKEKKKGR
jgi:hypothetical protein